MILVIDNYDSFTYNLVQYIGQLTEVEVVRNDALTVAEVLARRPAGIVISPGPGRPEDAGIAIDLIQAVGGDIPVLGVCLGHQAIAAAYGGTIVPAPRLMHGKADEIHHDAGGLLQNVPIPFAAGRYHSLAVDISTAEDLTVDAVSPDGTVMAISHASYPVYGIQFHPESVLTPEGITIITQFVELAVGKTFAKGGARP